MYNILSIARGQRVCDALFVFENKLRRSIEEAKTS
jgi:hypothetical protein